LERQLYGKDAIFAQGERHGLLLKESSNSMAFGWTSLKF
jgi:hypothetical protein